MKTIVNTTMQFEFTPYDDEVSTAAAVQTEVEAEIMEMLKELETKPTMGETNVIIMGITVASPESNSYYQTKPA